MVIERFIKGSLQIFLPYETYYNGINTLDKVKKVLKYNILKLM
jgi:hypothetical protein